MLVFHQTLGVQVRGKTATDLYLVFPRHYCSCQAFLYLANRGDAIAVSVSCINACNHLMHASCNGSELAFVTCCIYFSKALDHAYMTSTMAADLGRHNQLATSQNLCSIPVIQRCLLDDAALRTVDHCPCLVFSSRSALGLRCRFNCDTNLFNPSVKHTVSHKVPVPDAL